MNQSEKLKETLYGLIEQEEKDKEQVDSFIGSIQKDLEKQALSKKDKRLFLSKSYEDSTLRKRIRQERDLKDNMSHQEMLIERFEKEINTKNNLISDCEFNSGNTAIYLK